VSGLSIPLKGKTLPINFTQSWVQAYFDILWANTGLGTWGITFRDWFSSQEDMPLYAYYKNNSSQFEPVDYWFFEQTRKGLDNYIGERSAYRRSEVIGFEWWSYLNDIIGNNIIPPYQFLPPLSNPLSEEIYELTPQQFTEYRIRLAVSNFAKNMEAYGGIICKLDQVDRGLQISFPECPFCANELPGCNILFGVVQGMLLHLCGILPVFKWGGEGKLIFSAALDTTQRMQYQLVENDSHLVQLKFTE
jgi:hypothetical protein